MTTKTTSFNQKYTMRLVPELPVLCSNALFVLFQVIHLSHLSAFSWHFGNVQVEIAKTKLSRANLLEPG